MNGHNLATNFFDKTNEIVAYKRVPFRRGLISTVYYNAAVLLGMTLVLLLVALWCLVSNRQLENTLHSVFHRRR